MAVKGVARWAGGVGSVLSSQAVFGWLVATSASAAVALALAVLIGLVVVVAPVLVLAGTLPATFGYWRIGPASADLSVADVALAAGSVAALPFAPWRSPAVRSVLRILVGYLAVLLVTVVLNPSERALLEWGHRLFLVAGAVLVGAALSRAGASLLALRAFVAASAIVAGRAVVDVLLSGGGWPPDPAFPFDIQKNTAGFLLAAAFVVLVVVGRTLRIRPPVRLALECLVLLGLLATQSRGAVATLAVVLALWSIWSGRIARSPSALLMVVMLAVLTYAGSVQLFSADELDSRFSSVGSRLETNEAALDLWREQPVEGVGLKYWRDADFAGVVGFGEPHNVAIAAMGESGLIGLVAILGFIIGVTRALRRMSGPLAVAALLLFVGKAVNGLIDIYWVAGTFTLAMIVVGMAAGASDAEIVLDSSDRRAAGLTMG